MGHVWAGLTGAPRLTVASLWHKLSGSSDGLCEHPHESFAHAWDDALGLVSCWSMSLGCSLEVLHGLIDYARNCTWKTAKAPSEDWGLKSWESQNLQSRTQFCLDWKWKPTLITKFFTIHSFTNYVSSLGIKTFMIVIKTQCSDWVWSITVRICEVQFRI